MARVKIRRPRGHPPHPDVLIPAEWRVLAILREGRTNPEIAAQLELSVYTVRMHVSNMLGKPGFTDREQLAAWQGRPAAVSAGRLGLSALGLGWLAPNALKVAVSGAGVAALVMVGVAIATLVSDDDALTGRIVFTSTRDANPETYVINADGSGLQRLTDDPAEDRSHSLSPDGSYIAFQRGNRIYVMNADGSDPREIRVRGSDPVWSPDGTRIAFGEGGISVISPDGSGLTQLTTNGRRPIWSPDGSRIAFASCCDGEDIYLMNANGPDQTRLTDFPANGLSPTLAWSPDGERIAFTVSLFNDDGTMDMNIQLIQVDGSEETRLTDLVWNFEMQCCLARAPSWSPDGRRIVFHSVVEPEGNWDIFVMKVGGSGRTRLTSDAGNNVSPMWSR